ncbi:MAG: hypothetical protein AMS22_01840 [Thiotrichales bacterium SG8_50]|nr:MAG: hypothetical protein AMS22_01840 [Thiotrichales bacterium SG8_50]
MLGLRTLQRHLERIYEIRVEENVDRFLITDAELARQLDRTECPRAVPEKLLVHQDGDYVDLALYLDEELLTRWAADDPIENLHHGNLSTFCTVLEGVSHFLYLCWNATHDRAVTLLELELQAEVDKFILAAVLFGRQFGGRVPTGLHPCLFAAPSFDTALDPESLYRYRNANRYASLYCAQLQKRFLRTPGGVSILNELRQFYRLTHRRKLDRIRSLN